MRIEPAPTLAEAQREKIDYAALVARAGAGAQLGTRAPHPRRVALIRQQFLLLSFLTVPMLRAEWDWDNLRGDPEFKALLADPKNSAPR